MPLDLSHNHSNDVTGFNVIMYMDYTLFKNVLFKDLFKIYF